MGVRIGGRAGSGMIDGEREDMRGGGESHGRGRGLDIRSGIGTGRGDGRFIAADPRTETEIDIITGGGGGTMIALTIVVVIVDCPRGSLTIFLSVLRRDFSSTGKHSVGVSDVYVFRR